MKFRFPWTKQAERIAALETQAREIKAVLSSQRLTDDPHGYGAEGSPVDLPGALKHMAQCGLIPNRFARVRASSLIDAPEDGVKVPNELEALRKRVVELEGVLESHGLKSESRKESKFGGAVFVWRDPRPIVLQLDETRVLLSRLAEATGHQMKFCPEQPEHYTIEPITPKKTK